MGKESSKTTASKASQEIDFPDELKGLLLTLVGVVHVQAEHLFVHLSAACAFWPFLEPLVQG
eukprot:CAMPEP_0117855494 /NCGR_PEP_ID=MMETSP0950-20121206/658_1 /TAXON_ID=44440 /ORGANISM="Chattonella subsalsa, Strain CCMP2191" /LENGTH=61 /DNA_ID=CAMNT_0005704361 /DNA_START=296 /DNA_END=481 /DNA_ORIENTATION=-